MTKNILGLDLGTNSIGWALIELNNETKEGNIIDIGSRIIPMGAEVLNFEQGNPQTKNAERRTARSIRRMGKRYKARRNKLLYILQQTGLLPDQFRFSSPFENPLTIQRINLLPIKVKTPQLSAIELMQLKVKALNESIGLKELGKLIFNYNQLRGYSGGGNDDDEIKEEAPDENTEDSTILKYEKIIKLVKILNEPIKLQGKKKGKELFEVEIELEGEYLRAETVLNTLKKGEEPELQIIIRRDKKGNTTSINLSMPVKTNWRKSMEELEEELDKLTEEKGSEAFLCEYFLKKLTEKNYKIRSKVILRKRYQAEFDAIWDTQVKLNPEFKAIVENKTMLEQLSTFVFPGNNSEHKQATYKNTAIEKGLKYLIKEQIIYYQRELKDQSELIGFCKYEKGERVAPKSHPIFQEFKVWEQINKLSINTRVQKGIKKNGQAKYEYTDVPLSSSYKQWLYDELQKKKEVSGKGFYAKLEKEGAIIKNESFLNGVHRDAKFKGNETLLFLRGQLKDWFEKLKLDDITNLISFWEILYHAKGNEYDLNSDRCIQVKAFIEKQVDKVDNIDKLTIRFAKIKFARNYSALSLKAITNLLPLLRAGIHFNSSLPENISSTIVKLLNEKQDDPFQKSVQDVLENYQHIFLSEGGMQPSHAAMLVYGKHTAESFTGNDIKTYKDIQLIPRGELRNPLAEQLINETLKMVAEIWKKHKEKPQEVRIELARELKNSADERKKIYDANNNNRKINERVKQRLRELSKETSLGNIERYRLWSMQASEPFPFPEKANEPTASEVEKMRLWEEQKCISPYTGQPIPLSQLFDKGLYDIDHIIPKSRYFDDSLTNKVICERSVNIDKGNRTAWEYFETGSVTEKILSKEQFTNHVNQSFFGKKRKNLLAVKIPQDPVARQLKDTQYIVTRVREELSKIAGSDNVKTTTGGVTDYLRHNWGLTDKFKKLTKERFERAQSLITDEEKKKELKWSKRIDHRNHAMDALVVACTEPAHVHRLNNLNKELQDWLVKNKEKIMNGFEGTDEELIEAFLNSAKEKRESILEEMKYGFRNFEHPWKTFSVDAEKALQNIVVSHKPKEKLLIQKAEKGEGKGKQDVLKIRGKLHDATLYGISQGKESYRIKLTKLAGKQFATEKTIEKIIDPLIKDAIKKHLENYKGNKAEAFSAEGIAELNKERKIPIYGFKIYYKDQSEKTSLKKLGGKKTTSDYINDVLTRMIDTVLKEKLISHIDKMGGHKEAFAEAGINAFNKTLEEEFAKSSPGKKYKPVTTIKLVPSKENTSGEEEELSLLQLQRKSSYNSKLLVSTGSNYAFAVLEKDCERLFDEISFFDAAKLVNEKFKLGEKDIQQIIKRHFEEKNNGASLLFLLKQNEMVYLPSENEIVPLNAKEPGFESFWNDKTERSKNIYTVVKFSGNQIYFLKHDIATTMINKVEFGSQNCYEKVNGISIKNFCIKLKIDRLGNISPAKYSGYTNEDFNNNNLSEPETGYQKTSWKMDTANTLEEMNEATAKAMAQLSGEEHLKNATELIKRVYAENLKKPKDRTIKFRK